MPVQAEFQSPFGEPSPQPTPAPTRLAEQAELQLRGRANQLRTEADKRQDIYDLATSEYQAGKINDQDFLSTIEELTNNSFSDSERKKYQALYSDGRRSVLTKKLETEANKIKAKGKDKKIAPQAAYNALVQLGIQASAAGDEYLASKYFLDASLTLQDLKNDKESGGGSNLPVGGGKRGTWNDVQSRVNSLYGF